MKKMLTCKQFILINIGSIAKKENLTYMNQTHDLSLTVEKALPMSH